MKKYQNEYIAADASDRVRSEPLSIHAHPNTKNEKIIVFVHGLNGERYKTWGQIPECLFKEIEDSDFGFYGYDNGFLRLNPFRSISIEDEAQVLVDTLRDSGYQKITLMGHSLGGVLARVAVTKMVEMNHQDLLNQIVAMFLFAVPQLGAITLPKFLSVLNSDAAALSKNSEMIKRTTRVFLDHFDTDEQLTEKNRKIWLPVYCVQGAKDFWVNELSASLNIPSQMRKIVRLSHTKVSKGEAEDVSDWILKKLKLIEFVTPQTLEPESKMIRHGPVSRK